MYGEVWSELSKSGEALGVFLRRPSTHLSERLKAAFFPLGEVFDGLLIKFSTQKKSQKSTHLLLALA